MGQIYGWVTGKQQLIWKCYKNYPSEQVLTDIIRIVLTVAEGLNIFYEVSAKIDHMVIRALDMPSYKIRQHFGEANKFIYENLNKGKNVLVHCNDGISRVFL